MKVGQLCFFRLSSPAAAPYGSGAHGSRYQGQRGPTASRGHLSFHRIRIEDPGTSAAEGARGSHGTHGAQHDDAASTGTEEQA